MVVYELTGSGRKLAYAFAPLAVWGARNFMHNDPRPADVYLPEWFLNLLTGHLCRPAHLHRSVGYEFRIDDTVRHIRIDEKGTPETILEPTASNPDATFTLKSSTAAALVGGHLTIARALEKRPTHRNR